MRSTRTLFAIAWLGLAAALLVGWLAPATRAHPVDEPAHRWQSTEGSWYGPGFYGGTTACGIRYTAQTPGVALLGGTKKDCGTLIRLRHHVTDRPGGRRTGEVRETVVRVIDTGPANRGRRWDLSRATCEELGRCYTAPIDWTR